MSVSPEFINTVKKWVYYDNQIKQANAQLREWRKKKKELNKPITIYIKSNALQETPINLTDSKLVFRTAKRSVPVNKEYIKNRLTQYFGNVQKAEEVVEFIYKDREFTETDTISRRVLKRK